MSFRLTVLASGSAGNASLLEVDGYSLLIDFGLNPNQLRDRMSNAGASWKNIQGVILTHTHGDHWKARTLIQLRHLGVPLYCHSTHVRNIRRHCDALDPLLKAKLVHPFTAHETFRLAGTTIDCLPLALRHDEEATFGFRFESRADLFQPAWSVGYASDLGTWDARLARALSNVDALALEFNHDVDLLRASRRPASLISRIFGDDGHLSNAQGAALLAEILEQSPPGRLRHVIQLHLSHECNRPDLARQAAMKLAALACPPFQVHTAEQHRAIKISGFIETGVYAD